MCERYNGWKNAETWSLMLQINNDQGLQEQATEVVVDAFNEELSLIVEGEENPVEDRSNAISASRDPFKDWVEGWLTVDGYREQFGDDMPYSILKIMEDVGSLWRVDWYECAESLLEDRLAEFDAEVKTMQETQEFGEQTLEAQL